MKHLGGVTPMQSIPPYIVPNFNDLENEDLDALLFEFEVLCRGYYYCTIAQNLMMFPHTLKEVAIRWFMRIGGNYIQTWEDMKHVIFLKKCQDYCRVHKEISGMTQGEEECLWHNVE